MFERKKHIVKLFNTFSLFSVIFFLGFTQNSDETIIARVGDKTISLNEFIRRAEYTVRPVYCRNNTNLDKKIILNSLIAEKLLALTAGADNSFITKSEVETFLLGRKEQSMRLFLYNDEVKSKIRLDSTKIYNMLKYVGRKYQVSYVNLQDTLVVKQLEEEVIKNKFNFEKILTENYNLKEIPQKKVAWSNLEHPVILDVLFTKDYTKDEVIGPIKVDTGQFMFIKINGWIDSPALTEMKTQERFNIVKDVYEQIQGKEIFENYIKHVMHGKELVFNKEKFFALADIVGPIYMQSQNEKEELFKKGVWNYKNEEMKYESVKPGLDEIKNETLFTIDNQSWTVEKFLAETRRHPLVFREKSFSKTDFGFQYQLAILDMVRDFYLTNEAYSRAYDKLPEVTRDYQMWKDNVNALNEKHKILKEKNQDSLYLENYLAVVEQTFNPLIDSLQKKYSNRIFINVEAFNKIKLTNINMAATYSSSPFPQVVPGFPIITTDNKLDYGGPIK